MKICDYKYVTKDQITQEKLSHKEIPYSLH